jgi:formamidopyrimidine-DNA glycosylase
MPELPEVEFARRRLSSWLQDRTIIRARVPRSRVIGKQSPAKVASFLAGRTVEGVSRKGKSLLVRLSDEGALHLHLGMTGDFSLAPSSARHVRLALELSDGETMLFDDPRMFGRVAVGPWREMGKKYFDALGPDPMERAFTAAKLAEILSRSRRPIKLLLMDQTRIAGVGNIYASEALWLAKIDPMSPSKAIDAPHLKALHAAIRKTMSDSIARLEQGEKYLSQGGENHFRIYGREGEACPRCRKKILRYDQAGRSTYWCRACQRPSRRRSS